MGQRKIQEADVTYVARLARLQLTPEDTQRFARQLDEVLRYMETLDRIDTSHIPPTSHVLALKNVFREDIVGPPLTPDEALDNAPQQSGGMFVVPKVIETA